MVALASLIPELEAALRRGSPAKHAQTLRGVTDLFLENASGYSDEHVDLFDEVLNRLVVEVETKALAELAGRIASLPNAPLQVVRRLALDADIAVAGPVLSQSARLAEADLVEIAKTMGQAHLLAISGRPRIGAAVTDVLVGRGDGDVVRTVADNPGARLSDAGFSALVHRALADDVLAQALGQRRDIPRRLFRKLLIEATEIVRQRLLASARPETRDEIQRILANVSAQIAAEVVPASDYAQAQRTVLAMRRDGVLDEEALATFAASGRHEEAVAALSMLCAVPIDVVDRLLDGDRPDPVLILCKARGFAWSTARVIVQAPRRGRRISTQALDSALANFERLSATTAQRVLRFWQAAEDDLRAAE